jgi:hypothetical protein
MRARKPSLRPVTAIEAFYKAGQLFLENSNESIREVAVLVLVFIPVDLWKGDFTPVHGLWVLLASIAVFFFGWGCGLAAIAVKRAREKYEEEQGYEPGTGL